MVKYYLDNTFTVTKHNHKSILLYNRYLNLLKVYSTKTVLLGRTKIGSKKDKFVTLNFNRVHTVIER